jgi:wobble nucleotide-excising tRNase
VLTQIKKIKSLGVFDNYTAAAELPAFGRFNVVYGENGSGKTTLSRLLACLEAGTHPDHPDLEYSIESQSGALTQGTKYLRGVRVFNSDYVEANIGRFDGPLRHILIIGEENKAVADELKTEIATREDRTRKIATVSTAVAKLDNDKGKLFSQIAKTIGEATSGSTLRSYRKPDAEVAFGRLADAKPLTNKELEIHRATVRQEQMPAMSPLGLPSLVMNGGEIDVVEFTANAGKRAEAFLMRSAQAAVIERLVKNPAIAAWVDEGVHIHAGADRCEFCDQPLPAERMKAIAKHFSVEDRKLKEELESECSALAASMKSLSSMPLPDRLAFYSELRVDYDTTIKNFAERRDQLIAQLGTVRDALTEKLTLRTTAYERQIDCDPAALVSACEAIQAIIKRHQDKTASFDKAKDAAAKAIETHYLLTIKEQVDGLVKQAATLKSEADLLRDGGEGLPDKRSLGELSQSIIAKQARVSNAHAGGEGLTNHLKQFLGRTDLRFESGDDGYQVLRRGKPAKRLSEGEKTAIAFLYFLVQLKDRNFNLAEGVVVIDDPISSLDSSAIYQAFSFLKNETKDAKQLFILTHNFEFLKLLINWVENIRGLKKADTSYTMVTCTETAQGRSAHLAPLDQLLIEHATEYHYLFKVLYTFQSDGTILSCYHIPNIARKVLETFLDFHVPSKGSLYAKLDQVKFDGHKKTAINKFANDLSHHTGKGFDPALVAESQKNAKYLLEMIKAVAPLHYDGLEALSQPKP